MSASYGSGLFKLQTALFPHLVVGEHSINGEIGAIRRDIARVLGYLVAVTIEEYTAPPAAVSAAILAATASSTTAQTYQAGALSGSIGSGVISPPRNITVTTAGATPTHAPATVTVNGFDAQGGALTETITGVNGGAATYAGIKCFAKVTSISTPAAGGTDATFSVDTGIVIGLAQTPKLRAGQTVGLVRAEIVDGAAVSPPTGVLTTVAAHPPFGAYTPASAPNGTHKYSIEYEFDASLQKDAS